METTEDAEPTMTRPITHSSATTMSRTVETGTCNPPTCNPQLVPWPAVGRDRPETEDVRRAGVTEGPPCELAGRATAMLGPTPGACGHFPARDVRSGGGWG